MYMNRDKDGNTPLHTACQNQKSNQVQFIIDNNYDNSEQNFYGDTPLHLVCRNGSFLCAKILMDSNSDLTAKNNNGDTPLIVACRYGQLQIVESLLNANSNIGDKNKSGDTSLHLVCKYNHLDVAKLMLKHTGSTVLIREQNNNGDTPLHLALQNRHREVVLLLIQVSACHGDETQLTEEAILAKVKHLIQEGFDPSQFSWIQLDKWQWRKSLLHIACGAAGDKEAVELLAVPGKCNPDIKDARGWTPLHHACVNGHIEIVTYLIGKSGSNPNITTSTGSLPLQLVCSYSTCSEEKALEIIKFLTITAKCDPDATIYEGDTLLLHLLKNQSVLKKKIVKYLIKNYQCNLSLRTHDGNTALHIVCESRTSDTEVIKMISDRGDYFASIKNHSQEIPLHLACRSGQIHIVRSILSSFNGKCGLYDLNCLGHIPLFTALKLNHHKIVSLVISEMYNNRDKDGNTPLHLACVSENISLVHLIAEMKFDATEVNNDGDTALHIACRTGNLELVEQILKFNTKAHNVHNKVGDTPYRIVCQCGYLSIFQELLKLDSTSNIDNSTLLNLACEYGHTHVAEVILLNMNVDVNTKNRIGDAPLHVACKTGDYKLVMLLLAKECNINIRDSYGNTPLHLVCQSGILKIYEEVVKRDCDVNARNVDGDTPLYIACKHGHFEVIQQLINEPEIQIQETNHIGDTLLHILSRSSNCSSKIIQYVLEVTQGNPNMTNAAGETPIQLTSNPHIIRELIRYGANPLDVYISNVQLNAKHPPQPVVKVFIVGNPSVGKSTLTAALQKELSILAKVFIPSKKVHNVDGKTAGVIPYEFDSKNYGPVTLYDFAGQREFYSSHAAILQNSIESTPPIFIIVVDLREEHEEIKQNILYWLSFIENQCTSACRKPHVLIIGSHADVLRLMGENLDNMKRIIQYLKSLPHFTSLKLVDFVAMDCQYSQSSDMAKLRQYLKDSCESLRSMVNNIRFNAHCFLVYLIDTFKESKAITLDQILNKVHLKKQDVADNSPLFFLPNSQSALFDLCCELNDRGHILLLKDKHKFINSWVVFDKESLLNEVIGSIFAPEGLKQYCNLASNTGVVPMERLLKQFSNYNSTMLIRLLVHLEFCHEISDDDILQFIGREVTSSVIGDTYLFFPAFVRLEAPSKVWNPKPYYTQHFGWIIKCSQPEQFFTSRFLQVLLLRLLFSFPLVSVSDNGDSDIQHPILQRKCSIWKNGIFWGNSDGVETIVEVLPHNKAVVVLMRRISDETSLPTFLHLRSCVIKKVLATVSDFCAKVCTNEYLIDPSETLSYPISTTTLYSMKEIACQILKSSITSSYVVSENGESHPLKTLLIFEPYALLCQEIIAKIFGSNDAANKLVPDYVLANIADTLLTYDSVTTFAKLFSDIVTVPPTSAQLLQILKTWRNSHKGTYQCLHQHLDQYSIWSGRNLLVSAVHHIYALYPVL